MVRTGSHVLYRFRPGQVRAGQTEAAALVTRVNIDGTANLTVFADGTPDCLYLRSVPKASQEITSHCWTMAESDNVDIAQLQADLLEAHERIDTLEAEVKALVKRGTKAAA